MKLVDGKLSECEYLEDSIEVCGKLLEQCRRKECVVRKIKQNSLRVSVRALAVETGFDPGSVECPILERYDVSNVESEQVVEGKCNGKEFKEAYQR